MALKQTKQKTVHDCVEFRCKSVAAAGRLLSYAAEEGFVELISGAPDAVLTKVAGIALQNVENRGVPLDLLDLGQDTGLTDLPRNYNRNVTYQSGVVRLGVVGMFETDQVDASTIGQGSGLYIGSDGKLSSVATGDKLGHALGSVRTDGFVKVWLNIA